MTEVYRRKPKSERTPPIWKFESESTLQDALIDAYIHFKQHDPGYTREGIASYRNVYQRSATIHANPGKSVTLLIQERVVRWNWTAQKHFLKDETIAVRTVYITKKNRPAFYFYNIHFNGYGRKIKSIISPLTPDTTYDQHDFVYAIGINVMREWRRLAEIELGLSISLESIYPGIEYFGQRGFVLLGYDVMRTDSAYDATIQIFGKKCYRKDLVRAVGKKMTEISLRQRADILAWAALFKRLVPVDWLVIAINKPHQELALNEEVIGNFFDRDNRKRFRILLMHLKPNERRNILMNTHGTHHGWLLRDTIIQYQRMVEINGIPFPDVRSNIKNLSNLHDLITAENNRIMEERRRQYQIEMYHPDKMYVNQHESSEILARQLEADPRMEIRIARDYDTLLGWSNYMVNCISSYFTNVCILGGVYDNGTLIANFEIRVSEDLWSENRIPVFKLAQLLGKRNNKLDPVTKQAIEHVLADNSIRLSSDRWA